MKPDDAREIRDSIGLALEILIAALDRIDGDPDIETADQSDDECTGDPEPSLGGTARFYGSGPEHDLEEDPCDRGEPSLGWPESWSQGTGSVGIGSNEGEQDILSEPHDPEGGDFIGGGQGA